MIGIRPLSAMCVLSALSVAGCHSFYPYGMHPGMYGQPGGALLQAPQGTAQVTLLESIPAESSTEPVTEKPLPGTTRSGISREPVSAPDVQRNLPGADSRVPAPRDPAPAAVGSTPSGRVPEAASESGADLTGIHPEPVFLKPVVMTEEGTTAAVIAADGTSQPLVATDSKSELARDSGYRWLQGDLQYDVQRDTWHLVYDYAPFDDRFGGEVTLGGDLPFTPADNDLVYRVSGSFDQTRKDLLGKPVYLVSRVQRISF